jgi:hypothetical protein
MSEPTVQLDYWCVWRDPNRYLAPELHVPHLAGRVTGHPHHDDSKYIYTSRVMSGQIREGTIVKTRNTIYKLGKMDPGYKTWCEQNDLSIEDTPDIRYSDEEAWDEYLAWCREQENTAHE